MKRGSRVSLKQKNETPGMARLGTVISDTPTNGRVTVKWARGGIQTIPVGALDYEPADRFDNLDLYYGDRRQQRDRY